MNSKLLIGISVILMATMVSGCGNGSLKYLDRSDFTVLHPLEAKVIAMDYPEYEFYLKIDLPNGCLETIKRKDDFNTYVQEGEDWFEANNINVEIRVLQDDEAYYVYSFNNGVHYEGYEHGVVVARMIQCYDKVYSTKVVCSKDVYDKDQSYVKKIVHSAVCNENMKLYA
jgi:hypothetical protein